LEWSLEEGDEGSCGRCISRTPGTSQVPSVQYVLPAEPARHARTTARTCIRT
ncbi:hypothetical protein GX411_01045, partial [Candidatus Fermentibacteria bacterium]|nr:hypothetical protein [Candidatus Fermentibacteria bacterium]